MSNLNLSIINEIEYMFESNYNFDEIRIHILIKYNIDIYNGEFDTHLKRIGQAEFKESLFERYGKSCMITNSKIYDILQACHIIPFADSHDMSVDNGLILDSNYHKLFDIYIWSINPETLKIEINYNLLSDEDKSDILIQRLENKTLDVLRPYSNTLRYLTKHYEKFKSKN